MPRPGRSNVHINALLGNIAVNYAQKATNFVSTQCFPTVPVEHKSDNYAEYLKEDWLRDEAKLRVPGAESAGGNYEVKLTNEYNCKNYAFHKDVSDDERDNQDSPLDADRDAINFVMSKMLLKRERQWAGAFLKTSVWGTDLTGVTGSPSTNEFKRWTEASGVTIIDNVETWKEFIASVTGYDPNTMVMAPDVLAKLKSNSEIKEQIKYTERGIVTTDLLADLFGLERILVPKGVVNTAKKGATGSYSRIVSNSILLCYAAPAPSIQEPSAGYNFAWKGRTGNSNIGSRVKKFRMENLDSDRVEAEMSWDFKVVAADMGVYATGVVKAVA
ncbi:Uncharacterised protein [uncultured archaeon]|nr:Uncharacterised protein [uncultured archaeon]